MAKMGIIGQGYVGRSKNVNASRCVNFYPEVSSQDSKAIISLIGTPGTSYFTNVAEGIIRGMHTFNDKIYLVSGSKLYSVDYAGVRSSQLGDDLQTSVGRVVFSDNGLSPSGGNQIVMSDGLKIYSYNVSTDVFDISDVASYTNCFIGGYFVADAGAGKFQVSDLIDGSTWQALNFATAEAEPDGLVSVFNNHGELWLFGEYTTEVWYQNATNIPPFSRASGGVIDYGCAARYSIAKGNNTVFWLGNKRNGNSGQFAGVFMAEGYNARLISPQSINYIIDNYSVVDDAFAYVYTEEGHEFYVLTFPTANATWVYDTTTGYWHERSTYKDDPYNVVRHIGNCYCHFREKHYIGDYQSSNILEMSSDVYKDLNDPIVSFRTTNHIFDDQDLNNVFITKFQVDLETGSTDLNGELGPTYELKNIVATGRLYDTVKIGNYIYVTDYTNDQILKINVTTSQVEKTITVGTNPVNLIYAVDYIWVANNASHNISKIDPSTDTVISTIPVDNYPRRPIYAVDSIWVPCTGSNTVARIYTATESTVSIATGSGPTQAIYNSGSDYIWFRSEYTGGNFIQYDIAGETINQTVTGGQTYLGVDYYNGFLWCLFSQADTTIDLVKINYESGAKTSIIEDLPFDNTFTAEIVQGGDYLWFTNKQQNTLTMVDIADESVEKTITVGNAPRALIYAFGYVWVMNTTDATISIIDITDGSVINTVKIGAEDCRFLNYDNEYLWIPGFGSDNFTLSRLNQTTIEPTCSLFWSNDGGYTWSNEHFASIGKIGEYKKRVKWNRLGRARNKTFRLTISDPIKKVLLNQYIDIIKGTK